MAIVAFLGLLATIIIPSMVGIKKLGKIETNTENHSKQIVTLFDMIGETTSQIHEHSGDCDKERLLLNERQEKIQETIKEHRKRIVALEKP